MQQPLEALKKQYKQNRLLLLGMILLLAVAVIAVFFNRYVALCVIAISAVYQIFVLRRAQKKYETQLVKQNLLATVCKQMNTETLDETGGGAITEQALRNAVLVPIDETKNAVLLRQGVGGRVDGIAIDVCDATFAESFALSQKGKKRVHFNSGCWMRFRLPVDTGADWKILHKDAVPAPIRVDFFARHARFEMAVLPEPLCEAYYCYTPVEAPELPAGEILKQVRLLAEYTPGNLAIALKGDTLSVFLGQRLLARPASASVEPTQQMLDFDPMPELAYALRLAKIAVHCAPKSAAE